MSGGVRLKMETRKPPLTPQQARMMSLAVLVGGPPIAFLAHLLLLQPWHIVALWYVLVLYLTVGLSWSFLEWRTRHRVIRTWNYFIILAVLLFLIVTLTQDEHKPFPRYGILLLLLGGAIVTGVLGATAIHNFRRWRKGEFTLPSGTK